MNRDVVSTTAHSGLQPGQSLIDTSTYPSLSIIMDGFSVKKYNQLHSIVEATSRFKHQLKSAGITDSQLFDELTPLFTEENTSGPYSPYLIHHHFSLTESERMVSYGNRSVPSIDTSPNIVPECWLNTGEEIEHRYVDDPGSIPPPPSAEFFSKFRAILDKHGIDILGICYTPPVEDLAPGFSFLETLVIEERAHIINQVPQSSIDPATTSPSAWILERHPNQRCTPSSRCATNCANHTRIYQFYSDN